MEGYLYDHDVRYICMCRYGSHMENHTASHMENQGPANEACVGVHVCHVFHPKPSLNCVKHKDLSFFQGSQINLYLYTMTSKHVDVFVMRPVVSVCQHTDQHQSPGNPRSNNRFSSHGNFSIRAQWACM